MERGGGWRGEEGGESGEGTEGGDGRDGREWEGRGWRSLMLVTCPAHMYMYVHV